MSNLKTLKSKDEVLAMVPSALVEVIEALYAEIEALKSSKNTKKINTNG